MRKLIIFFVLLTGIFVFVELHLHHHDSVRVFRIATECDYPPHNWEEDRPSETNVPLANVKGYYAEGYDIQIAKLVADTLGMKLEVRKVPWQELIDTLNRREVDAIFSGMLDTSLRRQTIAFSEVYDVKTSIYGVMVRRDGKYSEAKDMRDLIGATFIAQKDSNFDRAIAQIKGVIHLPPVNSVDNVFNSLVNGKADATVLDLDSAKTYERLYPDFKTIKFEDGKGFKFDFTGICAGVRKDDTKLLEDINGVLKSISKRDRQRLMDQSVSKSLGDI